MKIGILFALKEELDAFLSKVNLKNSYEIFDLTFYECEFNNINCVLVECGIGKVNAARCAQIMIDNIQADYIINAGVAGGVSEKLDVCDIVLGEKMVQHDFDLTAFNHEKGYIPNVGRYIDADEYLLKIAEENSDGLNVHKGVIASGDIFVTEEKMSNKINTKFNALCVEMEGASIAQVCYLSHTPFLVIRSISDSPKKGNNKIAYEEFVTISSAKIAEYMKKILISLSKVQD